MDERTSAEMNRRRFLKLMAGGAVLAGGAPLWLPFSPDKRFLDSRVEAAWSRYRVGVGKVGYPPDNAYCATRRAVAACQEWPAGAIAGRTVMIKPNLVVGMPAQSGVTTDPEVVRALVDLALESGAGEVIIVEGGPDGAQFSLCGYDLFDGYHQRVRLAALEDLPIDIYRVDNGMAYAHLYMRKPLMEQDVVLISVAKMKTHNLAHVSLATKNLLGLPPWELYRATSTPGLEYRFAMHARGVSQAIVDMNLVRPVDFAVVDGVWAMEGRGPVSGTPVKMDVVLAGGNVVAVDRVCLEVMGIPQNSVQHLRYAADKGLGPADMSTIDVVGGNPPSHPFELPATAPVVDMPQCQPRVFWPKLPQSTDITYWVDRDCRARVDIVRTSDIRPSKMQQIRRLRDWTHIPAGEHVLAWDGKNDKGHIVPAGVYAVRVRADSYSPLVHADSYAMNWVAVARA